MLAYSSITSKVGTRSGSRSSSAAFTRSRQVMLSDIARILSVGCLLQSIKTAAAREGRRASPARSPELVEAYLLPGLDDEKLAVPVSVQHLEQHPVGAADLVEPQAEEGGHGPGELAVVLQFVIAGVDERDPRIVAEQRLRDLGSTLFPVPLPYPLVLDQRALLRLHPSLGEEVRARLLCLQPPVLFARAEKESDAVVDERDDQPVRVRAQVHHGIRAEPVAEQDVARPRDLVYSLLQALLELLGVDVQAELQRREAALLDAEAPQFLRHRGTRDYVSPEPAFNGLILLRGQVLSTPFSTFPFPAFA